MNRFTWGSRKFWREEYEKVSDELSRFRLEAYESQLVKEAQERTQEAYRDRDICNAKVDTLYSCNQTLTNAINNLTSK